MPQRPARKIFRGFKYGKARKYFPQGIATSQKPENISRKALLCRKSLKTFPARHCYVAKT
jgi:hypothetical protein